MCSWNLCLNFYHTHFQMELRKFRKLDLVIRLFSLNENFRTATADEICKIF